jgi:hypothetical protein
MACAADGLAIGIAVDPIEVDGCPRYTLNNVIQVEVTAVLPDVSTTDLAQPVLLAGNPDPLLTPPLLAIHEAKSRAMRVVAWWLWSLVRWYVSAWCIWHFLLAASRPTQERPR